MSSQYNSPSSPNAPQNSANVGNSSGSAATAPAQPAKAGSDRADRIATAVGATHAPPKPAGKTTRIGPYILSKTLGMGSTGRVKLGVHYRTQQKVAVKIIPKPSVSTGSNGNGGGNAAATLARKLEREIVIMKLVQHPSVMQLYDVYETDDELYLVLEHVEGGELFDYLVKRGRLDEREACTFFQQIILGLDYCHKHQICHRDLKPENLLLDSQRRIKLADFGMASLQQYGKMLETSCGSPHYASPEIIKGIRYDGAMSDIWSCGVILYALLSGNLPFDDENIRRLLSKVKTGKYHMPSHISPSAQDLIARMLAVDPEQRLKMVDVISHPWFKTVPPPAEVPVLATVLGHSAVAAEDVDDDLVSSLGLLGWPDAAAVRAALAAPEPAQEKVYYHLLRARKAEYLRQLAEDEDAWDDDEEMRTAQEAQGGGGGAMVRRRAESYASVFSARKGRSENGLNAGASPTGSKDGVSPKDAPGVPEAGSPSPSPVATTAAAATRTPVGAAAVASRAVHGVVSLTTQPTGSPTSPTSPSSAGASAGSPRTSSPLASRDDVRVRAQSSAEMLASPRASARAAALVGRTQLAQMSGGVAQSAGSLTSEGSGANTPASGGPSTPKFHRKRPGPLGLSTADLAPPGTPLGSASPSSAISTSTPILVAPKRSWFASLMAGFSVPGSNGAGGRAGGGHAGDGSVLSLTHGAPQVATLALVKRVLPLIGVKVQDGRNKMAVKCKYEVPASGAGAISSVMASQATLDGGASFNPGSLAPGTVVKFRVDIGEAPGSSANNSSADPTAGTSSVVTVALQQGSVAVMAAVVSRMRDFGVGAGSTPIPVLGSQVGEERGSSVPGMQV